MSPKQKIGIGLLAALVIAGAAYYFFFSDGSLFDGPPLPANTRPDAAIIDPLTALERPGQEEQLATGSRSGAALPLGATDRPGLNAVENL